MLFDWKEKGKQVTFNLWFILLYESSQARCLFLSELHLHPHYLAFYTLNPSTCQTHFLVFTWILAPIDMLMLNPAKEHCLCHWMENELSQTASFLRAVTPKEFAINILQYAAFPGIPYFLRMSCYANFSFFFFKKKVLKKRKKNSSRMLGSILSS